MPGRQVTCDCGRRRGTVSVRFTEDLDAAADKMRAAVTAACPHCQAKAPAKPDRAKNNG